MNRFYKFCEETTFNGLTHVSASKGKVFWIVAFALCSLTVTTLFGVTLSKYRSRPTGVDQQFLRDKATLPKLAMCSYWIAMSASELGALNVSRALAAVLQWRIEQPYHVAIANANKHLRPHIRQLLEDTRPEYDSLMEGLGFDRFDQLVHRLVPKNQQREIIMKTQSGGRSDEFWFQDSDPDVVTYAKDYMDFFNFYCKILLVPETDKLFITLNPPAFDEIYREDIDEAAMRLLPYMRSVTLRQFDGTVVTKIRPGYQYYVSYRKTTTELINTETNPCVPADEDRDCEFNCYIETVRTSTPGCRHCQSVFLHAYVAQTPDVESTEASPRRSRRSASDEAYFRRFFPGLGSRLPVHKDSLRRRRSADHDEADNATEGPPHAGDMAICDPWEWTECDLGRITEVTRAYERCKDSCLPSCHYTSYRYQGKAERAEAELVASEAPWIRHQSWVNIVPEEGPQSNILVKQYEIMDLAEVFSSFGGYMGLFLGSSVLTLVHICTFLAGSFRCRRLFRKRRTAQQRSTLAYHPGEAQLPMANSHPALPVTENSMAERSVEREEPGPQGPVAGAQLGSQLVLLRPPPASTAQRAPRRLAGCLARRRAQKRHGGPSATLVLAERNGDARSASRLSSPASPPHTLLSRPQAL